MLKRATVYLNPKLHQAVRIKAIQMNVSMSDLVNEALKLALREDALDLQAIKERAHEPARSFETVVEGLKKDGLL